jgi:hypothetical protein
MNELNEEHFDLKFKQRETESVNISIPTEVIDSLKRIAAQKDMSEEALLKLYIGQGLRQDLSRLYSERVLETTAQVLSKHIRSEEEVSTILNEIRAAAG